MSLAPFHPVLQRWFSETIGTPTTVQLRGWEAIRERRHTLIAAPTGSGKTLAAFLTALDELLEEGIRSPLPDEVRVVYVSPLEPQRPSPPYVLALFGEDHVFFSSDYPHERACADFLPDVPAFDSLRV